MERPITKPLGTPIEELDTPALVVDLDALEHNLATVHGFFKARQARVRPFVSAHLCPAIAHKQMAAGGTVGGVALATVGEAEVFAQQGFTDIFIANQVVTAQKIQRVCALAQEATIVVATDSLDNVRQLAEAAASSGVTLKVRMSVQSGADLYGVEPGKPALELARAMAKAPGLRFDGLVAVEGTELTSNRDNHSGEVNRWLQPVLDTRELLEREGITVDMVSAGGTHNYDVVGSIEGVTEVPAGRYALMEASLVQGRPELKPAARVLSTVTSRPQADLAIIDSGQKSSGRDTGFPVVENIAGATLMRNSAEHGNIELRDGATDRVKLGDKVWLIPWDSAGCVNLYDYMRVTRKGKLAAVWEISARGKYR